MRQQPSNGRSCTCGTAQVRTKILCGISDLLCSAIRVNGFIVVLRCCSNLRLCGCTVGSLTPIELLWLPAGKSTSNDSHTGVVARLVAAAATIVVGVVVVIEPSSQSQSWFQSCSRRRRSRRRRRRSHSGSRGSHRRRVVEG